MSVDKLARAAQLHNAMMALTGTSTTLSDAQALQIPDLFPTWEQVLSDGAQLQAGRVINKDGTLYRVEQTVAPLESQPPGGEGMLAIYRPIDRTHAGTLEDPIPWVYGMNCTAGIYYSYNGHTYQVAPGGDMIPCTWHPETAGMWQWVFIE